MANILDTDLFKQGISEIPVFTGATSSKDGVKGFVPAPSAGDENKFLCGNGDWKEAGSDIIPSTIKSFSEATEAEITKYLKLHRAGLIDLSSVWKVGDERKVHLSAMAATGVGESHVEQDATLVILHGSGAFDIIDGTKNDFVIGLKNFLSNGTSGEYGYINSTSTNVGGWKESLRRAWCDNIFMKALPTEVQKWFRKFKYKASDGNKQTTSSELENFFTFASVSNVFGPSYNTNYAPASEDTVQFEYYKTAANMIKKAGDSGSAYHWWLCSPGVGNAYLFCHVTSGGGLGSSGAGDTFGLSPFGCV